MTNICDSTIGNAITNTCDCKVDKQRYTKYPVSNTYDTSIKQQMHHQIKRNYMQKRWFMSIREKLAGNYLKNND